MIRPVHILKRCIPLRGQCRTVSQEVHRMPKPGDPEAHDEDFADPRPPWVYTSTRLLSYTIIPTVSLYAIFFYDFGDHEHVFTPARRWLAQRKAAFFTLSPAEAELLRAQDAKIESALESKPSSTSSPT